MTGVTSAQLEFFLNLTNGEGLELGPLKAGEDHHSETIQKYSLIKLLFNHPYKMVAQKGKCFKSNL